MANGHIAYDGQVLKNQRQPQETETRLIGTRGVRSWNSSQLTRAEHTLEMWW